MSQPRSRSRHILCALSSLGGGGAERVMLALAAGWRERGHAVTLLTLDGEAADAYAIPQGVARVALGLTGRSRGIVSAGVANVRRVWAMRQAIRAGRPDVVVSFVDRTNVRVLLASRGLDIPVIVSERNEPNLEDIGGAWRTLRGCTYPRCDALVMQTEVLRPWGAELAGSHRVVVIPNPVVMSSAPGRPDGPREQLVLAAGRLIPPKGFDLLIDAFGAVAPEFHGWRLVILGEGPERGALEERVRATGHGDRISLVGWVTDPSAYFRKAGLFVLSSRSEGFPNVLVEAMAEGCPVLAADCPSGPAEIVRHGADGFLVEAGKAAALADGLRRLLADEPARARFGLEAMGVRERYSLGSVLDQWDALIADTLARRGAKA